MSLKAKILRERKINKTEKQVTTQFYRDNNEDMDVDDLDALLDQIHKRGKEKHDNFSIYLIRILNGANWITFKDFDDLEDYYSGKVKEDAKFYDFSQVQITCIFS